MKKNVVLISAVTSCMILAACNTQQVKDTFNETVGEENAQKIAKWLTPALFGAASFVATKNVENDAARFAIIAAATGAGVYIGNKFAESLSKKDQEQLFTTQQEAASTGKPIKFQSESGAKGVVSVVETAPPQEEEKVAEVKILKDKVDKPVPLKLIGDAYTATPSSLNVRSGPGTDYRVVSSIKHGEAVEVIGSAKPTNTWYAISQYTDGAIQGYVSGKYMEPAQEAIEFQSASSGAVQTVQVETTSECKTLKTDVVTEDNQQIVSEDVYCIQPNGSWKIS